MASSGHSDTRSDVPSEDLPALPSPERSDPAMKASAGNSSAITSRDYSDTQLASDAAVEVSAGDSPAIPSHGHSDRQLKETPSDDPPAMTAPGQLETAMDTSADNLPAAATPSHDHPDQQLKGSLSMDRPAMPSHVHSDEELNILHDHSDIQTEALSVKLPDSPDTFDSPAMETPDHSDPEMMASHNDLPAMSTSIYVDAPMSQEPEQEPEQEPLGAERSDDVVAAPAPRVVHISWPEGQSENSIAEEFTRPAPETVRVPFALRRRPTISRTSGQSSDTEPFPAFDTERPPPVFSRQLSTEYQPLPGDMEVQHIRQPVDRLSWGPDIDIQADEYVLGVSSRLGDDKLGNIKWYTVEPGIGPYTSTRSILAGTGEVLTALDAGIGWVQRPERISISDSDLAQPSEHTPILLDQPSTGSGTGRDSSDRPILRRIGSHRPPPSTPPGLEPIERLSMPTLPALFHNTIPILLEQYKLERASDPAAFDIKTRRMLDQQLRDKMLRGGGTTLRREEYTAEVASRLDAEMVCRWEIRPDYRETPFDGTLDDNDEEDDNKNAIFIMPLGFRLSDHVRKTTNSGEVYFTQSQRVETVVGKYKKIQTKTLIEVTEEHIVHDEDDLAWTDVVVARQQQEKKEDPGAAVSDLPLHLPTRASFRGFVDPLSVEARLSDVLRGIGGLQLQLQLQIQRRRPPLQLDARLAGVVAGLDWNIWSAKAAGGLVVQEDVVVEGEGED